MHINMNTLYASFVFVERGEAGRFSQNLRIGVKQMISKRGKKCLAFVCCQYSLVWGSHTEECQCDDSSGTLSVCLSDDMDSSK